MRILVTVHGFLTPSMTFVYNQISAMQALGHEVFVVACVKKNEHLFPLDEVVVIPEESYSLLWSKIKNRLGFNYSLYSRPFVRAFRNLLAEYKPDIVHVHFGPHLLRVLPAFKERKIPVVATFHGIDASRFLKKKSYQRALFNAMQNSFVYATTVAQDMKNRFLKEGIPVERVFVDYLGVDTDFFIPTSDSKTKKGQVVFLQVANFVEKKGHVYTIEAFKRYFETGYNDGAKLVLAGDGPLLPHCKKMVESMGLKARVEFPGLVDRYQVRELMDHADYFVHHSVTAKDGDMEGLPTVIMEALSMGLPVLSTYHAGIEELIDHGINGLLVPERDIASFAVGFKNIEQISKANLRTKVVESFNLKKNTENIVGLFNQIVK